jgi:MoxR-like ATPase
MDVLKLSDCKNAAEVKIKIEERIASIPCLDVVRHFRKSYYNIDSTIEFLYASSISGSNGILYGPGGFGKTELTKKFFEYFKIPVNVIVGYHDMDVEGLLGIPDMKKLMEESEYVTAFNKSVLTKPGILLLEEFLDVRPSTAAALKDILTEGGFRQGDKFTPALNGQTFICSNKDPEELSVDFSTSAFYKDRFPCNIFVAWDNYTTRDYNNLFKIVFSDQFEQNKDEFNVLAGLCSRSSSDNKVVSPRTAIAASRVMLKSGIHALKFVSELDTSILEDVNNELKERKAMSALLQLLDDADEVSSELVNSAEVTGNLEGKISLRFWLTNIITNIEAVKCTDDMLEITQRYKTKFINRVRHLDRHLNSPYEELKFNEKLGCAEIRKLTDKLSR